MNNKNKSCFYLGVVNNAKKSIMIILNLAKKKIFLLSESIKESKRTYQQIISGFYSKRRKESISSINIPMSVSTDEEVNHLYS